MQFTYKQIIKCIVKVFFTEVCFKDRSSKVIIKMSNGDESYEVIFNWAIENFDDNCVNAPICSPVCVSKLLDNTHFQLTLTVDKESLGCYFRFSLKCFSDYFVKSKIDCEVSIVDIDGSLFKKTFEKLRNFGGYFFLVSMYFNESEDVFGLNRSKFIPQDTLTIRWQMKKSTSQGKHSQPELHSSRVRIERSCFFWTIENFCDLQPFQKSKMHLVQNPLKLRILTFEVFFDEEENLRVQITLVNCTQIINSFFKVSILDETGEVFKSGRSVDSLPGYPFIIAERDNLVNNKNLCLPMDILTLEVECFFTIEKRCCQDENIQQFSYQDLYAVKDTSNTHSDTIMPCTSSISIACPTAANEKCNLKSHQEFFKDMQRLREEGLFSDTNLVAGGSVFQAHKTILSARSSILKDILLQECDYIDIKGIDEDTLKRMMQFMYSDRLEENLQWEGAVSLYFAADSYKIVGLKQATYSVLKSSLSASNVCEILERADLHGDRELKSTALDFIVSHDDEVLVSEEWKEFILRHMELTTEILSKVLRKKNTKKKKSKDNHP